MDLLLQNERMIYFQLLCFLCSIMRPYPIIISGKILLLHCQRRHPCLVVAEGVGVNAIFLIHAMPKSFTSNIKVENAGIGPLLRVPYPTTNGM